MGRMTGTWIWTVTVIMALLSGSSWVEATGFDGNGYSDLVVGVIWEDVGSINSAGAVSVAHGSSQGVTGAGGQFWHQDAGLDDSCESMDQFGESVAVGDFNGDGFFDLAVGTPREDYDGFHYTGIVHVVYGSPSGLDASGSQLWTQDNSVPASSCEHNDAFGRALAVGDFDHDGFDDLAIGSPDETWNTVLSAGAVVVLYGTETGLTSSDSDWWIASYLDGEVVEYGHFGNALATGDLNGDGYDELVIGAEGHVVDGEEGAGAVFVAHGSATGLRNASGDDCWHQGRTDIVDDPEQGDSFGDTLAIGDLDGNGYDDLVVGVPDEGVGSTQKAGMIHLLYGSSSGITATGSTVFHQDNFDSNSPAEDDDAFGGSLAVGDFNDDDRADVAVGAPFEDWGTTENVGMIHVLWGAVGGVTGVDALWLNEDQLEPGSSLESWEQFGEALAAGDFDADGHADLAVSATGEDQWDGGNLETEAGVVFILEGTDDGLSLVNTVISQCSGLPGECDQGDRFGTALAATPGRELLPLFDDDFESGSTGDWSSTTP